MDDFFILNHNAQRVTCRYFLGVKNQLLQILTIYLGTLYPNFLALNRSLQQPSLSPNLFFAFPLL